LKLHDGGRNKREEVQLSVVGERKKEKYNSINVLDREEKGENPRVR